MTFTPRLSALVAAYGLFGFGYVITHVMRQTVPVADLGAAHEIQRIEVDSPFIARDMDTWDDYRALHLEVTGRPAPAPPRD